VLIDGGRNGNDVAVASAQIVKVCGVTKVLGGDKLFLGGFKGEVVACFQFINPALINVKTDDGAFAAKLYRERETDIAQANDGEFDIVKLHGAPPLRP
jgi:hypothetical protein